MPMDRALYPENWHDLAAAIKQKAGMRCEQCGRAQGDMSINRFGSPWRVIVSAAHPDHDPHNPEAQMRCWCLSCHCRYDASHGQRGRKRRMMAMARGQLALFDLS